MNTGQITDKPNGKWTFIVYIGYLLTYIQMQWTTSDVRDYCYYFIVEQTDNLVEIYYFVGGNAHRHENNNDQMMYDYRINP